MERIFGPVRTSRPFSLKTFLSADECLSKLSTYISLQNSDVPWQRDYIIKGIEANPRSYSFGVALVARQDASRVAEATGKIRQDDQVTIIEGRINIVGRILWTRTLMIVAGVLFLGGILTSNFALGLLVCLVAIPFVLMYLYLVQKYREILIRTLDQLFEAVK